MGFFKDTGIMNDEEVLEVGGNSLSEVLGGVKKEPPSMEKAFSSVLEEDLKEQDKRAVEDENNDNETFNMESLMKDKALKKEDPIKETEDTLDDKEVSEKVSNDNVSNDDDSSKAIESIPKQVKKESIKEEIKEEAKETQISSVKKANIKETLSEDIFILPENVRITGDIEVDANAAIYSSLNGSLTSSKKISVYPGKKIVLKAIKGKEIHILKGSIITGDIYAETIKVEGAIKGNLFADEGVILSKDAIVFGNINTPYIEMEKGVKIDGNIIFTSSDVDESIFEG